MKFQPRGGMCMACEDVDEDCSEYPFETMRVIATDGDTKIVKCEYYNREEKDQDG